MKNLCKTAFAAGIDKGFVIYEDADTREKLGTHFLFDPRFSVEQFEDFLSKRLRWSVGRFENDAPCAGSLCEPALYEPHDTLRLAEYPMLLQKLGKGPDTGTRLDRRRIRERRR